MSGPATEGERWAEAELGRLREACWAPRAVARFLTESQHRATRTRRERPLEARRAAAWMAAGAVAWSLAARLGTAGAFRRAGARGLIWWAGCALMLDWHLGMLQTPAGEPVTLGAADALTLARAWLVPAVACDPAPALVIFGALSDLADGAVARSTRTTRLGRDLEGLVDACFTVAALHGSVRTRRMSRLPAVCELVRLTVGTVYAAAVYFVEGHAPDRRLTAGGRRAGPLRMAGLVAASHGRRRLADRLLYAGTVLALAGAVAQATPVGGRR